MPVHEAVAAFARTARLENPALEYRVAALAPDALTAQLPVLLREFGTDTGREAEVRYERGRRLARRYRTVDPPAQDAGGAALRDGGVYLITGGGGGIGLLLAEHLARRVRANLVLVGRSEPDPGTRARLEAIAGTGGSARYLRADVSREDDVRAVLAAVEADHGTLNGVVHAAGVLRDSFLAAKSPQDLSAVLAPKVHGTVHLDRLTAHHPLDFFAAFSSVAAPLGNVGQADYAYANAFMDAALAHRERLVADGRRSGRSVSIAWPLWRDGGMAPDEASAAELERRLGSAALPAPVGLTAFETALTLPGGAVLVALGDPGTVQAALSPAESPAARPKTAEPDVPQAPEAPAARSEAAADPRAVAENLLRETLAARTKLDQAAMDPQAPLDRYGIDSLLIVQLNSDLEETFGELSKTLFFEYPTLAELAGYFADHHADRLRELAPADRPEPAPAAPEPRAQAPARSGLPGGRGRHGRPCRGRGRGRGRRRGRGRHRHHRAERPLPEGRRPGRVLAEPGAAAATASPRSRRDRWDHAATSRTARAAPGRAYGKWGGFLDGVDRFDPLFFGISPREAELMDPQERLFLQTVWHAMEDAGYRPRATSPAGRSGCSSGVMYAEYQLLGAAAAGARRWAGGGLAARLDRQPGLVRARPARAEPGGRHHVLVVADRHPPGLREPARRRVRAGDRRRRQRLPAPAQVRATSARAGSLSADGRCRAFGAGGDGYVPGEGVGAVLLKPLRRALADGDHIHGVIRAARSTTAAGPTATPCPTRTRRQRVIEQALRRAGVDPRDIGYIEAHGTGTSLGDPIEIAGLRKAFAAPADRRPTRTGSTARSARSSRTSATWRRPPASRASPRCCCSCGTASWCRPCTPSELNPNIDFAGSPVPRPARARRLGAADRGRRRARAAPGRLSSFGAGGANAHLVLAEPPRAGAQDAPAVPAAEQRTSRAAAVRAVRVGRGAAARVRRPARPVPEHRAGRPGRRRPHPPVRPRAHGRTAGRGRRRGPGRRRGRCSRSPREPPPRRGCGTDGPGPRATADPAAADAGPAAGWPAGGSPGRIPATRRSPRPRPPPGGSRVASRCRATPSPGSGTGWTPPETSRARRRRCAPPAAGRQRVHPRRDPLPHHAAPRRPADARPRSGRAAAAGRHRPAGDGPGRRGAGGGPGARPPARRGVGTAGRGRGRHAAGVRRTAHRRTPSAARRPRTWRSRCSARRARPAGSPMCAAIAVTSGAPARRAPPLDLAAVRQRCAAPRDGSRRLRATTSGPVSPTVRPSRSCGRCGSVRTRCWWRHGCPSREETAGAFTLHPALLDGLLRSVHWMNRGTAPDAGDLVVPFSLGEIEILAPRLPPVCFAHAVPARGSGPRASAVQRFDVVVVDERGTELVRVARLRRTRADHPAERRRRPQRRTRMTTPPGRCSTQFGWEPSDLPAPAEETTPGPGDACWSVARRPGTGPAAGRGPAGGTRVVTGAGRRPLPHRRPRTTTPSTPWTPGTTGDCWPRSRTSPCGPGWTSSTCGTCSAAAAVPRHAGALGARTRRARSGTRPAGRGVRHRAVRGAASPAGPARRAAAGGQESVRLLYGHAAPGGSGPPRARGPAPV